MLTEKLKIFLNRFNFKETNDLYSYYFNNGFYKLCIIDYVRNFRGHFKQYLNTKEDTELMEIYHNITEKEENIELDNALQSAQFFICQECTQLHIINKNSTELKEGDICKQCFKGHLIKENPNKTSSADKIRTIIKYDNRKLYDTFLSKYVNLKDIINMIQTKQIVKLIVKDYKSNKDITKKVLLSAVINNNVVKLNEDDLIEMIKGEVNETK